MAVVLSAAVVIATAASASAGAVIDRAVSALRSNPVYVDPGATINLSPNDVSRLRQQIATSSAPIYIAVLPPSAADEAGSADNVPSAVGRQLGTGAVGTVAGNKFRAGASRGVLPSGRAAALAKTAFDDHHTAGLYSVLSDFVSRVKAETARPAPAAGGGGARAAQPAPQKEDKGVPAWLVVLAVVALCATVGLAIAFYVVYRNRKREREEEEQRRLYQSMSEPRSTRAEDYTDGEVHQARPRSGDRVRTVVERREVYEPGSRWYPGGYYGGMYYYPGYYPGSFMEGMLWGSLMFGDHDRDDHDDHDRSDDRGDSGTSGGDYDAPEPAGDYDSGSDSGTSGGGGDFGSGDDVSSPAPEPDPEPAPSYDPPDPSPSYEPSYDSGGGSDWGGGGGGFDSGGGGFDSGGGGGGDF